MATGETGFKNRKMIKCHFELECSTKRQMSRFVKFQVEEEKHQTTCARWRLDKTETHGLIWFLIRKNFIFYFRLTFSTVFLKNFIVY